MRGLPVVRGLSGAGRPEDDEDEWLGGRRWTGYGAILVVAVVAQSALVWWHQRGSQGSSPAVPIASGSATTGVDVPAPGSTAGDSGAGTASTLTTGAADTDQTVPTAAPRAVTWQVWHAVLLPFSASAGPAHVRGQAAYGFAHTPVGALIAAAQAGSRRVAATDPGWRDVVSTMIAPGPGRDVWISNRSKVAFTQEPAPGTFSQLAAFQFVSYSPADAVIQLVSRASDGSFGVLDEHVVWQDGDWKLVLAPDGGEAHSMLRLNSLAGFIAWGGI